MSKLYGMVDGDRAQTGASRQASRNIVAWVQTETGRVTVSLNASGEYAVAVCPVSSYYPSDVPTLIASGRVPGAPTNGHLPKVKKSRKAVAKAAQPAQNS